jgi:hypothetical protein
VRVEGKNANICPRALGARRRECVCVCQCTGKCGTVSQKGHSERFHMGRRMSEEEGGRSLPNLGWQSARRLDPSATLCQSSRHGKVKDLCFRACPSSFRARWTLISSLYGQVPASFAGCLDSSCYLRSERISTRGGLGSLRWCKGRTG